MGQLLNLSVTRMMCRIFLILSIVLFVVDRGAAVSRVSPSDEDASLPVVHAPVGSLRGLRAQDGNYSMFMGIPYAQVDPDNLFGNAKPYQNFEGIFDAFDDTSICPQEEQFNNTIVGSLDCLHINVYVPDSASDDNRLPVFVYIYGGNFKRGFASRYIYGPSFLVRHDIILVTFNYRTGPYGFMCLDIPEVPGNQGLKDQEMALKWIRHNIEAFGGDNNKITIGGNSAGAMSADLHLYYGQEDNLFQKIIPQSGVALIRGIIGDSDPSAPLELAKFLNHNPTDIKDALSFLATVDPHKLIATTVELDINFIPCVEKEFENVQRFITGHPVNINVLRVKDIEVLIGLNNDESLFYHVNMPNITYQLVDFVNVWLAANFDFENEPELFAEMHEIVSHFYFGDEDVTFELRRQVIDLESDFTFNYPILRTVKKYLDNGVRIMYLYMFSYLGGRNYSKNRLNITGGGAAHADELGYLFDISYMDKPLAPEDQLIVDRMTELWANFIKYGNPTPEPTELNPVLWQPVTPEKLHFLELDTEVRVSTRPMHARMAFLDLFFKTNAIYQKNYEREEIEDPDPELSSGNNLVLDLSLSVLLILTYFLLRD